MKVAILKRITKIEPEREDAPRGLSCDPLVIEEIPIPSVNDQQVLIKVSACGVCYTDIDIVEGRVLCKLPIIPGHQIIGKVVDIGKSVTDINIGDRVGVAWIGHTCGGCFYCANDQENLCQNFKATGCNIDGGYAQYTVAFGNYVYHIPRNIEDKIAAPLMCAGAVGYRALRLANMVDGLRLRALWLWFVSSHINSIS